MTRAAAPLFPNSRNKNAPGYGAFSWCRFDLGSLAGKISFARRDVDRHTLGMMLADVPAVYCGERLLRRVPAKTMHRVAAATFALLGALALIGTG